MAGTLVAVDSATSDAPASAANAQAFNPGNIISDSIFYNSATMTAGDIQAFLNARVPKCRSGYTCLKDYAQQTTNQTAKSEGCAAYTGQYESAASIIYKVATACGINPQSLLVLLEKETSLVTDDWPSAGMYRKAAGYGCPDTASCDSTYYGFFNQVYNAAWQFKKYQARPLDRGYIAGRTNTIAWHPNSACGTSSVYIENQATAGLYVYTPYRPNSAALANGYGTGDGCSSYGNRNFYLIFTDWFGTTQGVAPHARFVDLYTSGALGVPVGNAVTSAGIGVEQQFQKGWAYWSPSTGAVLGSGALGNAYRARGGTSGGLGFPMAAEKAEAGGGASQRFQGGWLYWSGPTGAHQIGGAVGAKWLAAGGPSSGLGYPTSDDTAMGAGSGQAFTTGSLYWSAATGVQQSSGAIGQRYVALGGPTSGLGFPVANEVAEANGGTSQQFKGGRLYWSSATGAHQIGGAIGAYWLAAGGPASGLGYPVGNDTAMGAGSGQAFKTGSLYWSAATGVQQASGAIGQRYVALGGPVSGLGFPVAGEVAEANGGTSQQFRGGRLYWSASTGAHQIGGAIGAQWLAAGGPASGLGYPVGNDTAMGAGSGQAFKGGSLYWSAATGVQQSSGAIGQRYVAVGGPAGGLGFPMAGEVAEANGGTSQKFQRGRLYWSSSTGAHQIGGAIGAQWLAAGGSASGLGYPVGEDTAMGAGSGQAFKTGSLYWSAATGVQQASGAIGQHYVALGGPAGRLGFPVAGEIPSGNGDSSQKFQGGTVYWSSSRAWEVFG
ncbi:hypothetical protein C3B59_05055 [Cryobacterium zongtaii]|uniref:LGFP repeat-containing protein n=2 Tax=Cryobacterium zongtaii TaxID=1259217 RepID=A0A2S3ZM13_9MICO|nr:hypothetical protein C3B59_05055 [Cryobacterium zongtaii]